ncbi:hypothetical protein Dimus_017585 [Dionaea muscipula]
MPANPSTKPTSSLIKLNDPTSLRILITPLRFIAHKQEEHRSPKNQREPMLEHAHRELKEGDDLMAFDGDDRRRQRFVGGDGLGSPMPRRLPRLDGGVTRRRESSGSGGVLRLQTNGGGRDGFSVIGSERKGKCNGGRLTEMIGDSRRTQMAQGSQWFKFAVV